MDVTAIIILEYNNVDDTVNCIESVLRYNTAPVRFIVIDNGSPDAGVPCRVKEFLTNRFGSVTVYSDGDVPQGEVTLGDATFIHSSVNDGYARGNNKGLRLAYADKSVSHVMILNSDILFVEDIIPELIADIDRLPDAAFLSPVLYKKGMREKDYNCARRAMTLPGLMLYCGCLQIDIFKVTRRRQIPIDGIEDTIPIELPSGSCMLCRKEIFSTIGSFDPNTFLYYEENILWEKVRSLGRRNYIDTRLKCIHLGATSTRRQPSLFIAKAGSRSINYFATTYLHAGVFARAFLRLTTRLNELKIRTLRALRN